MPETKPSSEQIALQKKMRQALIDAFGIKFLVHHSSYPHDHVRPWSSLPEDALEIDSSDGSVAITLPAYGAVRGNEVVIDIPLQGLRGLSAKIEHILAMKAIEDRAFVYFPVLLGEEFEEDE